MWKEARMRAALSPRKRCERVMPPAGAAATPKRDSLRSLRPMMERRVF